MKKQSVKNVISYLVLTLGALMFVYPFIWMLSASVAQEKEITNLILLPGSFSMDNYLQVINKIPAFRALLNSLIISAIVTAGAIIFTSMVGYALAHLEFRGRQSLFYLIIFTMSIPFQITLIPQYILMVEFRWIDTFFALTVPYFLNGLGIIMFRQYFRSIPKDMIDAARIDGCSEFRILFSIVLPNSVPAIITIGIITFMGSWNEVLWPIIVIRDQNLMTMPQLIALFAVGGRAESQLGVKLASATMLALPILVAYTFFQKYFIQSMASTGIKE